MNPQSSQQPEASSSNTQTAHDQHGQYPQATTVDDFRHNLATVHARIEAACQRVGRDPATVRLLPVSKTKGEDAIRAAYAAGCRFLGENKVQEAYGKWQAMQDLTDLKWSVIGHLQTNKAKVVARFAAEFQALDSLRVAEAWTSGCRPRGGRWMCLYRSTPRASPASSDCHPRMCRPSCRRCLASRRYGCGG